ncbi:MAG TPA: tetratricopeptide repeat protein [bacterium]|nr:tetratricopeptide repeat protein [bacterium]HQG44646.1 tetratricopeptide repeat protein [bacterium]HQI48362.1 tetratricopeptide repeat protein [bacterium]HQJ63127.1 tetratricopeptide repeat protein [bacterium]
MRTLRLIYSLLFLALPLAAQTSAEDDLAQGDAAYAKFDNATALKFYQLAWKADSSRCVAAWKISRAHVDIGEMASKEIQRTNYYAGEKFARKAVALCPNDDMAHLTLAIVVGRVALMEGGKKKVELSKEVKSEAEKTLQLNPNNDIACHVLGRWNREVANLSGVLKMFAKVLYGGLPPASNEKAVELFKKAIALKPDYCNHYLELGITFQEMDQYQPAKEAFEKALACPNLVFNDDVHKKEAKERLDKVTKKLQ